LRQVDDGNRERLASLAVVAGRPGATELYTSAVPGEGSALPFYERYGFVRTGEIDEGEVVLRLGLTAPMRRPNDRDP